MSFFVHSQRKSLRHAGLAALLLFTGLLDQTEAQSGRRAKQPQPSTSAIPSPVTNAEPPPLLGSLRHKVNLLIGREPTKKHLHSEDVIFASFVKHLNQYVNVSSTPIGDVKESQAVTRAKGETDSLVVLLHLEIDGFQDGTIILNSPDLEVEYLVLAPGTGKKLTKGKVYYQAIGGGRMRKSEWPGGTPIKITPEAAGIEAAEHVHDWLRLDEMRKESEKQQ